MSRSLVAATLFAAATICSAEAQAENLLYGLVDVAASRSRPPGGQYQDMLDDGDMSRSYLGFRGSEDLGGGLRAVFKLETYLRLSDGEAGSYSSGMPTVETRAWRRMVAHLRRFGEKER